VRAALLEINPALPDAVEQYPYRSMETLQAPSALVAPYTPPLVDISRIPLRMQPAYWASVLLWQMDNFEERFERSLIPEVFRSHIIDSFHRILDRIDEGHDWISPQSDTFVKDLAITRLQLLPAGARLIHRFVGISRKATLKGGLGALWYVHGRCGGSAPYLGWHLHKPMIPDFFNADGFAITCELTAQLIASDPRAKAALGTSWFYDPKIEEVSPRLSFCRTPVSKGAYVFKIGQSDLAIRNATSRSETRRALYEQGKYAPSDFALVWSRRDILSHYA
jgi:hypothetical protein